MVFYGRYWERRYLNRLAHELELDRLYEQTPILLIRVEILSASLRSNLKKTSLRVHLFNGDEKRKELFKSKAIKAQTDETQCAQFVFNTGVQFVFQGEQVLTFELQQPHMVLPGKKIGRCMLPLSEIQESIGGVRFTRIPDQPLLRELIMNDLEKPDDLVGGLQISLRFKRTNLLAALEYQEVRDFLDMQDRMSGYYDPYYDTRGYYDARLPYSTVPSVPISSVPISSVPVSTVPPGAAQVLNTADGGQMRVRSWTDPSTGVVRHEARRIDSDGFEVERVEWND